MQYSDDAKTEFKLNSYHDKGVVLSALQSVRYRGGNTKTGEALLQTKTLKDASQDKLRSKPNNRPPLILPWQGSL